MPPLTQKYTSRDNEVVVKQGLAPASTPAPAPASTSSTVVDLKPFWTTVDGNTSRLYHGHVLEVLRRMPSQSVQMVVTSPPYWALRDYGTGTWEGGNDSCDHVEYTAEQMHTRKNVRTLGMTVADREAGTGKVMPASNAAFQAQVKHYKNLCKKCGARRVDHQLGSEEIPDCQGWAQGWNCADPKHWIRGNNSLCKHRHTEQVEVEGSATGDWEGESLLPDGTICDHKQEDQGEMTESFSPLHGTNMSRPAGWHGSPRCSTVKPTRTCFRCGAKKIYSSTTKVVCLDCGAEKGNWELACHVCRIRLVFAEVYRVLRDDGTLWLDYGDTYSSGVGNNRNGIGGFDNAGRKGNNPKMTIRKVPGIPPGNMVGVPWRVAFALQADGWILRQDIIWNKVSPLPESVRNRCTKAHEYVFLMVKNSNYFCDMDAIREKTGRETTPEEYAEIKKETWQSGKEITGAGGEKPPEKVGYTHPGGRNKRSVWPISSQGYEGAHFAVFPPALITPCILAGTSAHGACAKCGAPWKRLIATAYIPAGGNSQTKTNGVNSKRPDDPDHKIKGATRPQEMRLGRAYRHDKQLGWEPTCTCFGHFEEKMSDAVYFGCWSDREGIDHARMGWKDGHVEPQIIKKKIDVYVPSIPLEEHPVRPCIVLDPFIGSGTTCAVSLEHGRWSWGIDLSEKYLTENAQPRIEGKIRTLARADELLPRAPVRKAKLGGVVYKG